MRFVFTNLVLITSILYSIALQAQVVPAASDTKALRDANSKLFVFYGTSETIDAIISHQSQSQSTVQLRDSHNTRPFFSASAKERESYLQSIAVNSDLIVIGEPLRRQSFLTEGGTFIASDYEITVDKVLRGQKTTILPGQTIVVTRAGGIFHYKNTKIIASVPDFELLHLHDRYVFFLRLLNNGSFFLSPGGSYNIEGPSISVRKKSEKHSSVVPTDEFMEDLHEILRKSNGGSK